MFFFHLPEYLQLIVVSMGVGVRENKERIEFIRAHSHKTIVSRT